MQLDRIDVAIITSLLKDGRKSFRQIAREIDVSTPTVTARFERLMNIGLIKSVSPIIDLKRIADKNARPQFSGNSESAVKAVSKLREGTKLKMKCDYCHGPISGKPVILRFANQERYLCCTECKNSYKKKYRARIESLSKHFQS